MLSIMKIVLALALVIFSVVNMSSACPRPSPPRAVQAVVKCGAVSDPTDGAVSYSSATKQAGTILTYQCNPGFYIQGPSMRNCQSNGQWSGSDTLCTPITCYNRAAQANGNVAYEDSDGQFTAYGKKATFTCNPGFVIAGDDEVTCLGTNQPGTWSAAFPTCGKQCPTISAPSNGQAIYSSPQRPEGSTVQFSCNSGFSVQGASELTCQAGGTWSGSAATCEAIFCPTFSSFANGVVSYSASSSNGVSHGGTASFSCTSPFTLKGTSPSTCGGTANPGTWSTVPFCSNGIACPDPGTLQNGQIMGATEYFDGATVTFTCNANYELNGPSSMTCSSSGTWSSSLPTCIEKRYDCTADEPCKNLVIPGKSIYRHVQDHRYVQCNAGACFVQICPSGLVFNGNFCDWPSQK